MNDGELKGKQQYCGKGIVMGRVEISDDLLALMRLIQKEGSTVCTGTCEHRKPNELHCHGISNALKISSSGAKSRLRELVGMGLLKKERVDRSDGKVLAKWTLSEEGLKYLSS